MAQENGRRDGEEDGVQEEAMGHYYGALLEGVARCVIHKQRGRDITSLNCVRRAQVILLLDLGGWIALARGDGEG